MNEHGIAVRFIVASRSAGLTVRPAALGVGVRQPGNEPVVGQSHQGEDGHELPRRHAPPRQPRHRRGRAAMGSLTGVSTTQATSEERDRRHCDQRSPPPTEPARERHGEQRNDGRAELHAGRVDPRAGRGAGGESLLHGDRRQGVAQPHPDPDRPGEKHDEKRGRHDCPEDPNVPISASPIVIATRVPSRAARYAATGANSPMHSTGIVPSNPITACDVPRSSWIDGISGPIPTIWGRSASAARNSARSVAVERRPSWVSELPLASGCARASQTPRRDDALPGPRPRRSASGAPRAGRCDALRPPRAPCKCRRARS